MNYDDDDRRFDYDYEDDFDRGAHNAPVIYMVLGVSVFVLILLGVILAVNGKGGRKSSSYDEYVASLHADEQEEEEEEEEEAPIVQGKITADDLDFWNMYGNKSDSSSSAKRDDTDIDPDASRDDDMPEGKPLPTPTMPISDDEKYDDGKHFKIEYADGSSEWLAIDTSRELNNYNFTNLKSNDGKMHYYLDGKAVSFLGIDVSRYQKDIDFIQVKNAGIDFVMIRVGARGYQSGTLSLDEYFTKNIAAATEAGLDV